MKRQTAIFFYVLSAYVVLQFVWWGFHLIELSTELAESDNQSNKRVIMIIGEGSVFFLLLILGLWKVQTSIKKELYLSQRQSNFLLSVTHELKTPLASSKLYIQTLLKHKNLSPEKQENLLKEALNSSRRLEGMIENILTATRIENHKIELVKTKLDLSQFISDTVEKWNLNRLEIQMSIQSNVWVNVDQFVIETVLVNLLDNGMKYGSKTPELEVYLYEEKDAVLFGVKDHGIGVPDKFKTQIFERFTRIGNEETRTQKGTGLGLYIVAELLSFHNAKIECLDNRPNGSDFKVTLLK